MRLRHLSYIAGALVVLYSQAAPAQQKAATQKYPSYARTQIVSECMMQPVPSAVKATPQQKNAYCRCYANYLQQNLPYDAFVELDNQVRSGAFNAVTPQIRRLIEHGTTSCNAYYILGKR